MSSRERSWNTIIMKYSTDQEKSGISARLCALALSWTLMMASPPTQAAPPSMFGIQPPSHESKLGLQGAIGTGGDGSGFALNYAYSFSDTFSASTQFSMTDNSDQSYVRGDLAARLASIGNSSLNVSTGISTMGSGSSCLHAGIWTHIYTAIPLYLVGGLEISSPEFDPGRSESSLITGIELPVAVNLGFSLLKQTPLSSEAYHHYATGLIIFF